MVSIDRWSVWWWTGLGMAAVNPVLMEVVSPMVVDGFSGGGGWV